MSKNKQAAKSRQQKAEKRARGRKARVGRRRDKHVADVVRRGKVLKAANLMKGADQVPDITDEEYVFWLCHGANYIASSEDEGLWEPIFEGIYEGRLPEPEGIAHTAMARYAEEMGSEETLHGVPRSVLAWTVSEKSAVRIYKFEAEKRIRDKNPECDAEAEARQPHNPVVWGIMAEVKQRTLEAPPAE